MKVYISIPFHPYSIYCIPGATTAPVNLRKKDMMTQLFSFLVSSNSFIADLEKGTVAMCVSRMCEGRVEGRDVRKGARVVY